MGQAVAKRMGSASTKVNVDTASHPRSRTITSTAVPKGHGARAHRPQHAPATDATPSRPRPPKRIRVPRGTRHAYVSHRQSIAKVRAEHTQRRDDPHLALRSSIPPRSSPTTSKASLNPALLTPGSLPHHTEKWAPPVPALRIDKVDTGTDADAAPAPARPLETVPPSTEPVTANGERRTLTFAIQDEAPWSGKREVPPPNEPSLLHYPLAATISARSPRNRRLQPGDILPTRVFRPIESAVSDATQGEKVSVREAAGQKVADATLSPEFASPEIIAELFVRAPHRKIFNRQTKPRSAQDGVTIQSRNRTTTSSAAHRPEDAQAKDVADGIEKPQIGDGKAPGLAISKARMWRPLPPLPPPTAASPLEPPVDAFATWKNWSTTTRLVTGEFGSMSALPTPAATPAAAPLERSESGHIATWPCRRRVADFEVGIESSDFDVTPPLRLRTTPLQVARDETGIPGQLKRSKGKEQALHNLALSPPAEPLDSKREVLENKRGSHNGHDIVEVGDCLPSFSQALNEQTTSKEPLGAMDRTEKQALDKTPAAHARLPAVRGAPARKTGFNSLEIAAWLHQTRSARQQALI